MNDMHVHALIPTWRQSSHLQPVHAVAKVQVQVREPLLARLLAPQLVQGQVMVLLLLRGMVVAPRALSGLYMLAPPASHAELHHTAVIAMMQYLLLACH